jgi:hypothetical protein
VTAKKIMASSADCTEGCRGDEAREEAVEEAEDVGDREVPPKLRDMGECLGLPPLAPPLAVLTGESLELPAPLEALPPPPPLLLPLPLPLAPLPAPAPPLLPAPAPPEDLVGVTERRGCRPTNTGAECKMRTLTTSLILGMACL